MEANQFQALSKALAFSALAELITGIALLATPTLVVMLIMTPAAPATAVPVARVAGIALIALGLACWPTSGRTNPAARRAMLTYNLLVAVYLTYLGSVVHTGGAMLWPVAGLHAGIAGVLIYLVRTTATVRQSDASPWPAAEIHGS